MNFDMWVFAKVYFYALQDIDKGDIITLLTHIGHEDMVPRTPLKDG